MSVITGRGTYQKGFTQKELREYVQSTLGGDFDVENVKLGPAGVVVKKRGQAAGDAQRGGVDAPPKKPLIRRDNPGGRWLKNKQEDAEKDMMEASSSSYRSKGLGGSVTGYMDEPEMLPVKRLVGMAGAQGERRAAGDLQFDDLMERVKRDGFDQQGGNAILIGVNHKGKAYILEGNTRLAVAQEMGIPYIRAEVRYFNGGEEAGGDFAPERIEDMVASRQAPEDEDTGNFARGGLALSESRKGIKTQAGKNMADKKQQLDRKKADLNGDGKLSDYEEARGEAIQKAEQDDELPEMSCGGIMADPMMSGVDPVSGNPIPVGATAENVRDDIPAMISTDEYVLPAHVVKYHGLKHIMGLQEEAEMGLMAMSASGLIQSVGDEEAKSDGEGSEDAEVSEEGRDAEEGEGREETLETPEGNEIEVAGVETAEKEFEDDETEDYAESEYPTKPSMFGMVKKPKVTFIV